MSISNIFHTNAQSAASAASLNRHAAQQPVEVSQGQNFSKSNVSLSSAGRQAYELEGNASLPGLEDMRVPNWKKQYLPPSIDLSASDMAINEAKKYQQIHDDAYKDGSVSPSERKTINSYRSSMQANETMRENTRFNQEYRQELGEYGQYVNEAYRGAMSSAGVVTRQDYTDFLNNEGVNIAVHDDFRERLFSNPRAVELMRVLGVDQASLGHL